MASDEAVAAVAVYLRKTLGETVPEGELDGWADVLEPVPDEIVREAVRRVVRKILYRKLPSPGMIYQEALALIGERMPSPMDALTAVENWVLHPSKHPLPPIVERVLDSIGKHTFREADMRTVSVLRSQFLALYREETRRIGELAMRAGVPLEQALAPHVSIPVPVEKRPMIEKPEVIDDEDYVPVRQLIRQFVRGDEIDETAKSE